MQYICTLPDTQSLNAELSRADTHTQRDMCHLLPQSLLCVLVVLAFSGTDVSQTANDTKQEARILAYGALHKPEGEQGLDLKASRMCLWGVS